MSPLWNTIWVSVLAATLAVGMGTCVGIAWVGSGRRLRKAWVGLCVTTLAMPPFLLANQWLEWTQDLRLAWGAERSATGLLPLTALVLGGMYWPVPAFAVMGAVARVESPMLEAVPGLRGWSLLRQILLPVAGSGVGISGFYCAHLAASNFAIPTLFQVRVLPEVIWVRFSTQLDLAGAWTAGIPMVVMGVVVAWLLRRSAGIWIQRAGGAEPVVWRRGLGVWWVMMAGVGVASGILTVGLPLAALLGGGDTWTQFFPALRAGGRALGTSVMVAGTVSVVLLGLSLVCVEIRGLYRVLGFMAWGAATAPGILLGALWATVLARPGMRWLSESAAAYTVVLLPRYLALALAFLEMSRRQVDDAVVDVLRTQQASRLRCWWYGIWPQLRTTAIPCAMAIHVLVLWDIESVVLIQPPGSETAAVRVFNLLHYGHASQVSAICLALLGFALLPVAVRSMGSWMGKVRVIGVALGLLATGCSRDAGGLKEAPLKSVLFERVQVIGERGVAPGQFNKPRSLVCDRKDNLYVADVTGRIQKFDREGRFVLQWQMPQTDLGKPKGMGLDREGRVVVVEPHYMRINHFDEEGRLVAQWGCKGTNAGCFILPRGIGVNGVGEFFVSEYTVVDRVQRFGPLAVDPATGAVRPPAFERVWGEAGEGAGQFHRAEGLGIGPDGRVYVADSCNHRIQVFDREGVLVGGFGKAGSGRGQLSYPYDVQLDRTGTQFICEFGNSRITVLGMAGEIVELIGGPGGEPGRFANPWAIALDSQGNLYVADSQNHRVQKLIRRVKLAGRAVFGHNKGG